MGKVLTFLGASLYLAWVVPAAAQGNPFQDVPSDHWAYQAVEGLRAKGILIGYPDGYFRGKRTLSRYEFAVALDRALKSLPAPGQGPKGDPGEKGAPGEVGPAGPQGEQGPTGVTPEELANIKRLAEEFKNELTGLGNNMAAVNRKLDGLTKQVGELTKRIDAMPKIGGGVFFGVRGDHAAHGYADYDGRLNGIAGQGNGVGFLSTPVVLHDLVLTVDAKIAGGATVSAALVNGNYRNYVGVFGTVSGAVNTNPGSDTYIDLLEIKTPVGGIGRDSNLTLGRFAYNVSPLTLWKPDVDSYFNNPWVDDGKYRMDGARLATKFGSLGVETFFAQTKSVQGVNAAGMAINSPVAGVSMPAQFSLVNLGEGSIVSKPVGQVDQGQIMVDQLAGITLGLPINKLSGGYVRFAAIDAEAKQAASLVGADFSKVFILGADTGVKVTDRLSVNADWAKTITGTGRFSTVNPHDNNAFTANVGYASGGLNVNAGYRYIDPMFYAPGYWGRIGNWINPTNVQGPTVRAGYDFSPAFGVTVGGDFYTGARNRAGTLSTEDEANRVTAGVRWDLGKTFRTTVDWEGVYWKFGAGSLLGNAAAVHPTEQYITIGTGLNLTENTILKIAYQIGDFNGHGALVGGAAGLGQYNYSALTGQVAVKF